MFSKLMTEKYDMVISKTFEPKNIGLAKKFVWLVNILFNKMLGENENCVFYFYLKPNELFGQPNSLHLVRILWGGTWKYINFLRLCLYFSLMNGGEYWITVVF